jgi:uncharacterized protein (DUF1015 family)
LEARAVVEGNADSFLRIARPEINLDPEQTADPEDVHRLGRTTLDDFIHRGILVRDASDGLLVYRQKMGESVQTGVVGCASVEEYRSGAIAIHEYTRPDKEDDRTRHIEVIRAHDEPVFLMYRPDLPGAAVISETLDRVTAGSPEVEFTTDDGVTHTLWVVNDAADVGAIVAGFQRVPTLYVADGHHRSAAAARVWDTVAEGEAAYFPVVAFRADELTIMAYNRVIRDLAEHTRASLVDALSVAFDVRPSPSTPEIGHHQFGLYVPGEWFLLTAHRDSVDESDAVARLDVSLLQDHVLGPLLGIADPRTDHRIGFVGGIRGTTELQRLVDSGAYAAAFALHPTSTVEVMDVADSGLVMPPKSTWFEPKLRSGLFVHPIDA